MSTCRFNKGEIVKCIDPDQHGNFLYGRLYKVWEDKDSSNECIRILSENSRVLSMYRSRFVRIKQKEFTDEEYESLLV